MMFSKTTVVVTRADKPMFTNACICFGLVIVAVPQFQFRRVCFFCFFLNLKTLFVWLTGDSNEVHGWPHQTDE